jgi:peptidoglycan/LPS O-acetylase OafA/YrhL
MIYRTYNIDSVVVGLILICVGALSYALRLPGNFDFFENFVGLAPVMIVAGTLALESTLRRAPNRVLHTIGNASYSIYLSHLFFLRISELEWRHFAASGSGEMLNVAYVVVAFTFAIAGGIAVHYFIERPMLNLFHPSRISSSTKPA